MKKRLISLLLATMLCVGMLPASVFAQGGDAGGATADTCICESEEQVNAECAVCSAVAATNAPPTEHTAGTHGDGRTALSSDTVSLSAGSDAGGALTVSGGDDPANAPVPNLPRLSAPDSPAWDSATPGKATWAEVTNASGYLVQLYKDGVKYGDPVSVNDTSYTFTAATVCEAGEYTFTVTAMDNGTTETDSPESQQSAALPFYSVTLPFGTGYTVSAVSGPASPVAANGSYTFTVYTTGYYLKGADFAVKANGTALTAAANGSYTIENINANQTIAVEGVVAMVAKVARPGGTVTGYATLKAALDVATDGDAVTLLQDTTLTTDATIASGVSFDTSGHTLTVYNPNASPAIDQPVLTNDGTTPLIVKGSTNILNKGYIQEGDETWCGEFVVTGGTPGTSFGIFSDELSIIADGLTVRNLDPDTPTNRYISISSTLGPVNFTLAGVNIKTTAATAINARYSITITLAAGTTNRLESAGQDSPATYLSALTSSDGDVTITGTGSLQFPGDRNSIGGTNVRISGGATVTAGGAIKAPHPSQTTGGVTITDATVKAASLPGGVAITDSYVEASIPSPTKQGDWTGVVLHDGNLTVGGNATIPTGEYTVAGTLTVHNGATLQAAAPTTILVKNGGSVQNQHDPSDEKNTAFMGDKVTVNLQVTLVSDTLTIDTTTVKYGENFTATLTATSGKLLPNDANKIVFMEGETVSSFSYAVATGLIEKTSVYDPITVIVEGVDPISLEGARIVLSGVSEGGCIYDGQEKKPSMIHVFPNGSNSPLFSTDYTVTYSNNVNAGTATVTVTGTGGYYTGTATTTFTILPYPLTVVAGYNTSTGSISGTVISKVYDGNNSVPEGSCTLTLVDNSATPIQIPTDLSVTYTSAVFKTKDAYSSSEAAGAVTVSGFVLTGAGAGNFTVANSSVTLNGYITQKPVTLTWQDPATTNWVYDGAAKRPAVTVNGLVAGDLAPSVGIDVRDPAYSDVNAGTVMFIAHTLTGNDNYTLSTNLADVTSPEYTIAKKQLSWDVSALTAARAENVTGEVTVYGTLALTGFASGEETAVTVAPATGLATSGLADKTAPGSYPGIAVVGASAYVFTPAAPSNYALPVGDPTVTATINAVTPLPQPPELAADAFRVDMETGISQVPEGLMQTPFDTPAKITGELSRVLTAGAGYTAENTGAFDVSLQFSTDGGVTWIDATEANFPAEGLTVILPYPAGTGKATHDFTVTHMFTVTSARLGTTAGQTEQPAVTKLDGGIQVTLKGLSPVGIAWKPVVPATPTQPAVPATPAAPAQTTAPAAGIPATGDNTGYGMWMALLLISAAGLCLCAPQLYKLRKKEH